MHAHNPDSIAHAAERIARSDALIVAAGADMGVDAGLPDFRGKEGFWQAYPAPGREQVDFYRIACPEAFRTHPARAWGLYGHWLNLYRQTEPHAGFQMLKRWGRSHAPRVHGVHQQRGWPVSESRLRRGQHRRMPRVPAPFAMPQAVPQRDLGSNSRPARGG